MYTDIAEMYNREMPEKYYDNVASFFNRLMKKYARPCCGNNIILDCGCGTGRLTRKLAGKGYDMIGLDISEDMLDVAENTHDEGDEKILWICQDMTKMDLFGTVGAIICATDTICHLLNEKAVLKFFSLASNYVEPGGIIVFDVLTDKYFRTKIDENVFCSDTEDYTCIWQGQYNGKKGICTYDFTVFREDSDGRYERFDEQLKEKVYSEEFLVRALEDSGFRLIGVYGDTSFAAPDGETERLYFAAQKPEIK